MPRSERRLVDRIDQFQQRHPAVGVPLAIVYKYVDDGGPSLAAQITYYAFVSLFPILLLASTILGIVLIGHPVLQQRVLESALTQLPVIGDDLRRPQGLGGGPVGIVVGLLGALYGAMGLGQALQNAANTTWTMPRNQRSDPFVSRGKSLVLLGVIGLDVLASTAVAGIVGGASVLGPLASVGVLIGTLAVHVVAFGFVFRFATTRELTRRQVLPGASLAAAAWLGLQYGGVALIGHTVGRSSATNGVFAVVLGLLGFLYLTSVLLVLAMELDVVLVDRLHPRALLTPFTDNVVLTDADKRSYTALAETQALKGFQHVEVGFEPSPAELAADDVPEDDRT